MTREVWLKADDEVGDWDARRRRITAGLEAGVDWVVVDEADVERVRELGEVNVAAFRDTGDVSIVDGAGDEGVDRIEDAETDVSEDEDAGDGDAVADAYVVGKGGEGDGSVSLPPDLSGSADLSTVRRGGAAGAYVEIKGKEYEAFA